MPQYKILVARYPYGHTEHDDVGDYLAKIAYEMKTDPRIGPKNVFGWKKSDTPITMLRNLSVEAAKEAKVDFMLMMDSDMSNDDEPDHLAKPFWKTAFDFMVDQHVRNQNGIAWAGPCIIAAPYGGPPPWENVYIFRWARRQNDHPNPDFTLEMFTREEAAIKTGIEEVAALPTGLMLIDMRVFDYLKPPYFYYEYTDKREIKKASTEDVTFTRDLSLAGIPIYVAWDCWSGHNKAKRVRKPVLIFKDEVKEKFADAIMRGWDSKKRAVSRPSILCEGAQQNGPTDGSLAQPGGRVCDGGGDPVAPQGRPEDVPGGVGGGTPG